MQIKKEKSKNGDFDSHPGPPNADRIMPTTSTPLFSEVLSGGQGVIKRAFSGSRLLRV